MEWSRLTISDLLECSEGDSEVDLSLTVTPALSESYPVLPEFTARLCPEFAGFRPIPRPSIRTKSRKRSRAPQETLYDRVDRTGLGIGEFLVILETVFALSDIRTKASMHQAFPTLLPRVNFLKLTEECVDFWEGVFWYLMRTPIDFTGLSQDPMRMMFMVDPVFTDKMVSRVVAKGVDNFIRTLAAQLEAPLEHWQGGYIAH